MPESESKQPPGKKPASGKHLAANRANAAKSTGPTSEDDKARPPGTPPNTASPPPASPSSASKTSMKSPASAPTSSPSTSASIPRNSSPSSNSPFASRLCSAPPASKAAGSPPASTSPPAPNLPLNEEITYALEITMAQNRNYCLADGFLRLARQGNGIQLFLRYQAQTERLYRRAVEDFERIRKLRPELPNEPISSGAGDLGACEPPDSTGLDPSGSSDPPAPNEPISPHLFAPAAPSIWVGQALPPANPPPLSPPVPALVATRIQTEPV